jgi:hypothetical protein
MFLTVPRLFDKQKVSRYKRLQSRKSQTQPAAERAIQTSDHFIAGLCTTDPNYPLLIMDRLLPQAQLTQSSADPDQPGIICPRTNLWLLDFNVTPIALAFSMVVHKQPERENLGPTR